MTGHPRGGCVWKVVCYKISVLRKIQNYGIIMKRKMNVLKLSKLTNNKQSNENGEM